jgi:hypothetical protein
MRSDKVKMGLGTDVTTTTENQPPAEGRLAPAIRPWTSEFLLPSVRYREPKQTKEPAVH